MQAIIDSWRKRPWWLNLIWYFCIYMTVIYMPFDMFVKLWTQSPHEWEEVWFGFQLTGWAAKATEPLHWLIYGAGAYGIWRMRPWIWPWAAVYSAQVVIAMVVWNLTNERGPVVAVIAGLLFMLPTVALYRAKALFQPEAQDPS